MSDENDVLISYGGAVKATTLEDGSVKLGGYLVRFSDPDNLDLTGEFFTESTNYGAAAKSAGWFNHRCPVKYDQKVTGYAKQLENEAILTKDEKGIFAEIILGAHNEYEKMIADLGIKGALGWSSGTASHLVDRKQHENGAVEILTWPLGLDASLTPTPAEPKNKVIPLKSLSDTQQSEQPEQYESKDAAEAAGDAGQSEEAESIPADESISDMEENNMDEKKKEDKEVIGLTPGEYQVQLDEVAKKAADAAVKTYLEAQPPVTPGAALEVTLDEADRPFKSLADQMSAVKNFAISHGQTVDPRLTNPAVKAATGANESVPSEAGFLLAPTFTSEVLKPMHEDGPFTNAVRNLPVSADSNYGFLNAVDETSRATGSRWGGIRGYRIAEAQTMTASQPKFRRINWELKEYAVLVYATDDLLKDSSLFSAVVQEGASEEISFMANDDIFRGLGTGGPTGFMNSGALVTRTAETGQAAATVVYENLVKMWQAMHPRYRAGATWYINSEVEPELDTIYMAAGTAGVAPRYVNYGSDGVMSIKGRPVVVNEFSEALGTAGDIVLANFGEYLFWEKGGVESAVSIHVEFLTNQSVFRWIYRCDGQTADNLPLTPYKGSQDQSAFVALATRA